MRAEDIPLRSAILIAHDKEGAKPILSKKGESALSDAIVHQLDYSSRTGVWEHKGGCDRSVTDDDIACAALREEMLRQLDYVSRTGSFSQKGVDRQVDCTFFGQHGPVSRDELERELARDGAGGNTFIRSILTVNREYAGELNMTRKEDFERLLRSTWSKAVVKWGLVDDPSRVRWVANYHTDAEHSLHVHITTWIKNPTPGERMEPGWTVPAKNTREAKELVYERAYKHVLLELDKEKDFYRDMARIQVRAELGIPQDPEMFVRAVRKAKDLGFPFAAEQTITDKDRDLLNKKLDEVAKAWDFHKGGSHSITSDRWMMSAARDVLKTLENKSEPYKEIVDAWRENCELRADAHGLAVGAEKLDEVEESASSAVTQHERNSFLRPMVDDLRARTATMLAGDIRDGHHPARLEHAVARAVSNVAYDDLKALSKAAGPDADIKELAAALVGKEVVQSALRDAVSRKSGEYEAFGIAAEDAVRRALPLVESQLVSRFASESRKSPDGSASPLSRDALQRVLHGDYAHLGLTKEGMESLRKDIEAGNYVEAARTIEASPEFRERLPYKNGEAALPQRENVRNRIAYALEYPVYEIGDFEQTVAGLAMCLSAASGGSERRRTRQNYARMDEARRAEEQKYADYTMQR